MMIREILVEPQAIAWLPWAVSYFFFIGLSFSAVFVAVFINLLKQSKQAEFIAMSLAMIFSIVAPIALTADLHQPSRIVNFYLHFTPWSWMAWGAIFLPLFSLSVAGYFLCLLRQVIAQEQLAKWLHILYWGNFNINLWTKLFRFASVISGILILLYTTMEVFTVSARPLWNHYWLMPLILFSVLPTTFLLIQNLVSYLTKQTLPRLFTHMSVALLCGFVLALVALFTSSKQAAFDLEKLWGFTSLPLLCLGLLALMFMLAYVSAPWLKWINVLFALCFTWLVRWILLIQVQSIGKYNALMNPYHLQWQVDGAIGILAIFALCILLGIIFWQLFSRTLVVTNLTGGKYE